MDKKKVIVSLATIGATAALLAGATFAYFSATSSSANNTFVAGTLNISVEQNYQTINPVISNWAPGDTTTVRFEVHNTGSLPVNLRAFAAGSWTSYYGAGSSDPTLVKVTKVEYYDEGSSSWQPIKEDSTGITGYVYYSPDGNNASLWTLAGAATEQFRLTVLFDSNANDNYQGAGYTAQVTAQAKQTNAPSWP